MIAVSSFKGKKLVLFGLGGSGLATAKACLAGGANIIVWDDRAEAVARAQAAGLQTQDLRNIKWSDVAALVLSPGVPLTHPEPHWSAALAHKAGVEIIGDIELFVRERNAFLEVQKAANTEEKEIGGICPFIAVTGTNGKSTTTALIAHILQEAGFDVQMGGNIGRPVLELDSFKCSDKQAYVVECSSYQINLAPSLNPDIGILLNVTPDHIDRHGSFENYAALKERLATQSRQAIICCGDASCQAIYDKLRKAKKKPIAVKAGNDSYETDPAAYKYYLGEFFKGNGELLRAAPILYSRHNAQNTLCALNTCQALGVKRFGKGLRSFKGLPHRLEEVGKFIYKDMVIRFINDSKATNAEAAAPALQSFKNIYWLAGGRAKAGGIKSLMNFGYMMHVKGCYFFGEAAADFVQTAHKFLEEMSGMHLPNAMDSVQTALKAAVKDMRADSNSSKIYGEAVILLSPACASFDQFRNFEERGKAFIALAEQAIKETEARDKERKG